MNYLLVQNEYLKLINKYNIHLKLIRNREEFNNFLNKI